MADSHPSRDTLEMFLRGQLPPQETREVVGHLLTDCVACQEVTGKGWALLLDGLKGARNNSSVSTPVANPIQDRTTYDRTFGRAMSRALNEAREVGRNCAAAEQLYEELMKHPPKRRLTLVRNSRRFQIPELCQLLIDKGFDQRFTEVQLGVELTELAIAVGQQLNDETYGPAETSDLVGRAWAYHGNALRVASDLRLADQAFQEAKRCFAEGVGGDLDKALVCRFSGLLLRARRDFEEAHSLQDHAIKLYLRHGETRLAARVMGDQALGVVYAGEPDRAIPCFERALELYVELGDEREVASARHNLAFCLTETGQHEKALAQVAEIRPLLEGTGDYLSLTRLRWLEGKILFALDRDWQAEKALVEAREAFIEAAIGYDAALVCLDLAAVYARRARTAEMRDLAEKMVPIFQSRDVHREAIAALIVFHEAALAETASLALVERISQYLRVAQHDPKLRFELA